MESTLTTLSEKGFNLGRILKPGTILFVSIGSTIGKVAQIKDFATTNQQINAVVPDEDNFNSDFVFSMFEKISPDIKQLSAQQAVPIVNKTIFSDVDICCPKRYEQENIGTYFRTLDHLITLHQCKYGKKEKETIFAWEQRKLGDIVQFSKGIGYSKADLKEVGTPIILYGRLYTKYETIITEVDTFADEKLGAVYSRGGEVIVPASGETAEDISIASVVEKSGVLLGGDLNIIIPPSALDSAFLAISISNGKPHNDMAKMAQGKSVVHLHNSDLEKIGLNYPCFEEQTRISGFFRGIDHLITLHQRKQKWQENLLKFIKIIITAIKEADNYARIGSDN